MPVATPPVDLEQFTEFAKPFVESGRYISANDVLRAAMDAFAREDSEKQKVAKLTTAIEEGFASGVATGNVFARVRSQAGLRAKADH